MAVSPHHFDPDGDSDLYPGGEQNRRFDRIDANIKDVGRAVTFVGFMVLVVLLILLTRQ